MLCTKLGSRMHACAQAERQASPPPAGLLPRSLPHSPRAARAAVATHTRDPRPHARRGVASELAPLAEVAAYIISLTFFLVSAEAVRSSASGSSQVRILTAGAARMRVRMMKMASGMRPMYQNWKSSL